MKYLLGSSTKKSILSSGNLLHVSPQVFNEYVDVNYFFISFDDDNVVCIVFKLGLISSAIAFALFKLISQVVLSFFMTITKKIDKIIDASTRSFIYFISLFGIGA